MMKNSLGILAALAASSALAQQVFELPEITLSANLRPTAVDAIGTSVTILDEAELEAKTASKVATKIAQTPSVSMVASGGLGQTSNLSIRGMNQNNIGVYYDGIDVTDPSNPQNFFDFGSLSGQSLGRVEVLRGSQGARYGSQAVGGVVAMQSKRPTEEGFHGALDVHYGTYETAGGSLALLYKSGDTEFALNYETLATKGFSAADQNAGNKENDGAHSQRFSLSGQTAISDGLIVGANVFVSKATSDYDEPGMFSDPQTIDGTTDDKFAGNQLGYRVFARADFDNFENEFFISGTQSKRNYEGTDQKYDYDPITYQPIFLGHFPTDQEYKGERQTIGYRGAYVFSDNNRVTVGIEHSKESFDISGQFAGNPSTSGGESELTAYYAELQFAPVENLDMTASYRRDDHSVYGEFDSYRLAAAFKPVQDVILRASYGTGYRAPSLYELYSPYGNLDLTPEETKSWDISAEYQFDRGSIKGTYFNIDTDNAIGFGPISETEYGYVNKNGNSTRKGFELEGNVTVADGLDLTLAYSHLDAKDAKGEKIIRLPEQKFTLGAQYQIDKFSVAANLTHVAGLTDAYYDPNTYSNTVVEFDDYSLLDARIGYAIGNGEVYLAGENLTDTDYQTVYGYGTPGRSLTIGYTLNF